MNRCPAPLATDKGFTIVEVMMVVAIIAILTTIMLPEFITYRIHTYNTAAREEAKNAYVMARAYFEDYPDTADIDGPRLESAGLNRTAHVYLFASGDQETLVLRTSHNQGDQVFRVDSAGSVK